MGADQTITYHDGSVYQGQLQPGEQPLEHGPGTIRFANGDYFEGHLLIRLILARPPHPGHTHLREWQSL
jgi:hypothetical protein